ncbi:MAG: hypothetical protein J1E02_03885 [Coprobacter sp.]|nr:hypothetical protein [Coprobacter sp.]
MSQKKNSSKLSIANLLAMAGLAGIGVITFFGIFFHAADGKPGGAAIGALALTAALALLLFLSIKAKSAEDEVDKWRYAEWAAVAIYIIVAAASATPFQRFFYVLTQKQELQAQANKESDNLRNFYTRYTQQAQAALNLAQEQIDNYKLSGQLTQDDLKAYVNEINDTHIWREAADKIVNLNEKDQADLKEINTRIANWNPMFIVGIANDLEINNKEAWNKLERKTLDYQDKHKLIPIIVGGGIEPYRLDGYVRFDNLKEYLPAARLAQTLREANGNTVPGWIVYVLLNLLVLFSYAVTSRSYNVPITQKKTGGPGGNAL